MVEHPFQILASEERDITTCESNKQKNGVFMIYSAYLTILQSFNVIR